MVEIFISALVIYLVIIDPVGVSVIFTALTDDLTKRQKVQIAFESVFVASLILIIFALFGTWLLDYLSISFSSFKISGGIILLIVSLDMLSNKRQLRKREITSEKPEQDSQSSISIVPLAMPMIAGPAAIASVMVVSANAGANTQALLLNYAALLLVMCITLLSLISMVFIGQYMNHKISDVFARITAIILAALSVQYIIDGLKETLF
ncbi:MAG: MarC family protein [Pseudomonadota bacterium]